MTTNALKYFCEAYLHMDWPLDGEWPEPIQTFKIQDAKFVTTLKSDIEKLLAQSPTEEELEILLVKGYGAYVNPSQMGLTWKTFLENILRTL